MKFLSYIIINLICIFIIYHTTTKDRSYVLNQDRKTVNDVNWDNSIDKEKTAYLLLHHESHTITTKQKERLMGLRLLLQTLLKF